MTFFIAQMTENLGLVTDIAFFRTSTRLVTNLTAILALVNTSIKWDTSIFKASKVIFGILGPFGEKGWALRFVRSEIADCILLADFTLQIDVGPGITMVFLLESKLVL